MMQTDAEAIDAWWRREDPSRTPRNDLRPLPCGAQLDISSVRLALTGEEVDSDFSFADILDGIQAAGFESDVTKYLVYYDGPVTPDEEGEVCGRGGSLRSGFGLAIVYVRACLGVSTAAVAAHEILHTFDAVPSARRTTATATCATTSATSCSRSSANSRCPRSCWTSGATTTTATRRAAPTRRTRAGSSA